MREALAMVAARDAPRVPPREGGEGGEEGGEEGGHALGAVDRAQGNANRGHEEL